MLQLEGMDPNRFDELCKVLLDSEYAPNFVVVDDAGDDSSLGRHLGDVMWPRSTPNPR